MDRSPAEEKENILKLTTVSSRLARALSQGDPDLDKVALLRRTLHDLRDVLSRLEELSELKWLTATPAAYETFEYYLWANALVKFWNGEDRERDVIDMREAELRAEEGGREHDGESSGPSTIDKAEDLAKKLVVHGLPRVLWRAQSSDEAVEETLRDNQIAEVEARRAVRAMRLMKLRHRKQSAPVVLVVKLKSIMEPTTPASQGGGLRIRFKFSGSLQQFDPRWRGFPEFRRVTKEVTILKQDRLRNEKDIFYAFTFEGESEAIVKRFAPWYLASPLHYADLDIELAAATTVDYVQLMPHVVPLANGRLVDSTEITSAKSVALEHLDNAPAVFFVLDPKQYYEVSLPPRLCRRYSPAARESARHPALLSRPRPCRQAPLDSAAQRDVLEFSGARHVRVRGHERDGMELSSAER